MNTLMNIDPWGFLDDLLDTGSRTLRTMRARAAGKFPPVNVYLDDTAVIIDMELPGRTAKDVAISLEPQAVVVSDKPAMQADGTTGAPEDRRPAWSRRLELPFRVNADKASAKFTDGILRIELPKTETNGVRHIEIK